MPNPFRPRKRRSAEDEELSSVPREELNNVVKTTEPLSLVLDKDENSASDLWRRALDTVQRETKFNFLDKLHPEDRNALELVNDVRTEASNRAQDTKNNERGFQLLGGRSCTYRQVYENIATCK